MSPHSRAPGAVTSAIAGARVHASGEAARQRQVVADAVALHPGRTSAQLAACCSLDRYQIARRLPEAEQAGEVHRRPPESLERGSRSAYTWWPGPAPVPATPPAPVTRADGQVVLL